MRITPSMRKNANQPTTHHMFFRRKDWVNESPTHRDLRMNTAYQMTLPRQWHDRLHVVLEPVNPPHLRVAQALIAISEDYTDWRDDNTRMTHMMDVMAGWSQAQPSPELADGMRETMTHLSAQLGILALYRSLRQ